MEALINLVMNAIDALSTDGRIVIKISRHCVRTPRVTRGR
jgi:signal transduction histidine kinase